VAVVAAPEKLDPMPMQQMETAEMGEMEFRVVLLAPHSIMVVVAVVEYIALTLLEEPGD
jgi:hypothetical protein